MLGFESPASDWSATSGASVGASADAIQGSHALAVSPQGWTELISAQMGGVSGAREIAELHVKLPAAASWGEMRLIAQIPSQGHYWRDLGAVALTGKAPGVWHTLTFQVPSDVRSAMGAASGDLNFRITVNAPSGLGQFLLDDLKISDDEPTGDPEPETSLIRFSLSYPTFAKPTEVFLSATSRLTLDDRVTAGEEGESPFVSSIGPETSEFGAGVRVYGNVTSEGNVDFLRSNSTVYGDVKTEGVLVRQNNVSIHGATLQGVDIDSSELEWDVEWPSSAVTDVSLPPDTPNTQVAPGVYDALQVFSRATATFTSGSYFFNSFVVEPQAHLKMDTSRGPIQIYVKDVLRLHVGLEFANEEHEQVLFAYLGHQAALFEEALHAAVIAPNGPVELRRPSSGLAHNGAFFGKDVHVFSDATVHFEPLDLSFLCGAQPGSGAQSHVDPSAREGNFTCPAAFRNDTGSVVATCYSGSEAGDYLAVPPVPEGEVALLFSGEGDDVLVSRESNSATFAGPGDDLVCALAPSQGAVHGGEGDDTLIVGGDGIDVLPGPGSDRVTVASGSARILIAHPCELEAGERYRLAGGVATLFSPLGREEMLSMGVEIDEDIAVEFFETLDCYSLCSGGPVCSTDEACVENDAGGRCLSRHPTFDHSVPIDERFQELDEASRTALRGYLAEIEGGYTGPAPPALRIRAPAIRAALLTSIARNSVHDRATEIYALGSLFDRESLLALEAVALIQAPDGLDAGHHGQQADWDLGQLHAVRWLHSAAKNLPDGGDYKAILLRVVTHGDAASQELAVNALLRLSPPATRAEIEGAIAPGDEYLLDLEFN